MRQIILLACTIGAIFTSVTAADAGRRSGGGGVSGWYESLVYVDSTRIKAPQNGNFSLCMLTTTSTLMFLPYWRSADEWVLSDQYCETEDFYYFDEGKFTSYQFGNRIDENLPPQPVLGLGRWVAGSWGLFVMVPLVLIAIFKKLSQMAAAFGLTRRKGPNLSPVELATLRAMCHAAKADGDINEDEVAAIVQVAKEVCGVHLTPEDAFAMCEQAKQLRDVTEFTQFGDGLTAEERQIVLNAVAILLTADGEVPHSELVFLAGVAHGLKIPKTDAQSLLDNMLAKVRASMTPMHPAR